MQSITRSVNSASVSVFHLVRETTRQGSWGWRKGQGRQRCLVKRKEREERVMVTWAERRGEKIVPEGDGWATTVGSRQWERRMYVKDRLEKSGRRRAGDDSSRISPAAASFTPSLGFARLVFGDGRLRKNRALFFGPATSHRVDSYDLAVDRARRHPVQRPVLLRPIGPWVQQHPHRASFCRHCKDGSGFEFAATAMADTMSAFTTVSLFR